MSDSESSEKDRVAGDTIKRVVSTSMGDNGGFQSAWMYVFTIALGIFLGLGAGVILPSTAKDRPAKFSVDSLPQHVVDVEYAVRGPIVSRALQIKQQLEAGVKFPFDEIVSCNVGNPQAVGQRPISFHRQVLSLLAKAPPTNGDELVEFLEQEKETVPADVFGRAQAFRAGLPLGAYTHSKGATIAREFVANFITSRDGVGEADPESIYLTDGASPGVKTSLQLLIEGPDDGILIPIPQYPLYSAAITNNRGTAAGYYLDEAKGWSVTKAAIEDAIQRFKQLRPHGVLRGLVVINPGNPTGNIMTYDELSMIIDLCQEHDLVLMSDEVYQENIWTNATFVSARKVLLEKKSDVPLFSFHSISKGFTGECGIRGGYMQIENVDKDVLDEIYKMQSVSLCANSVGQMMTASITNPPVPGDASWPLFQKEYFAIKSSQARKSVFVMERLNQMLGISCEVIQGAMYAFPKVDLPEDAIAAAKRAGQEPDMFFCMQMLEATGVVTVPGSGFGQAPGSWHFRMTILPSEDKMPSVLDRMEIFNNDFMKTYGYKPAEKVPVA